MLGHILSALCEESRPVLLGQHPLQGETSEAGVYPDLHLYIREGEASCGGWGLAVLAAGAGARAALNPSCGWYVHSSCAVTCAVRPPGVGQGEVRGKSISEHSWPLLQNPQ